MSLTLAELQRPWFVEPGQVCELGADQIGGKAAGLVALGEHAPPTVVLTASLFEALEDPVRATIRAQMEDVDVLDLGQLQRRSEAIEALLQQVALPDDLGAELLERLQRALGSGPYIVRSSAVGEDGQRASFAGQLRSLLGVEADKEALLEALRACWASRYSPQALAYEARGVARLGGLAVVIQPMIQAELGGVFFSRCPQGADCMRMEYVRGHPEPLVQGECNPGVLRLRREGGAIQTFEPFERDEERASVEVLAHRLAKLARALEGAPGVDLEWIVDEEQRLWIVQQRPITAGAIREPSRGGQPLQIYSNANMNENYPRPVCALLFGIAQRSYAAYFEGLGRSFGLREARIEAARGLLGQLVACHRGRLYYNLSAIHGCLAHAPLGARLQRYFDSFVGAKRTTAHQSAGVSAGELLEIARMGLGFGRSLSRHRRALGRFERQIEGFDARWQPKALRSASATDLLAGFNQFMEIRLRGWAPAAFADACVTIAQGLLGDLCARLGLDGSAKMEWMSVDRELASMKPVDALWELSRTLRAMEAPPQSCAQLQELLEARGDQARAARAYVRRWGFRAGQELMLIEPRMWERAELMWAMLAPMLEQADAGSPARRRAKIRAHRVQRRAELARAIRWPWRGLLVRLSAMLGEAIARRERARLQQARLYGALRRLMLELGRRAQAEGWLEQSEDILELRPEELTWPLREDLGKLAGRRRLQRERYSGEAAPPARLELGVGQRCPPPGVSVELERAESVGQARLVGQAASPGCVRAPARILMRLEEGLRLGEGEVLVTRSTDPAWGPLFFQAGALVMERGGMLSHGAIVAREFGIPAVLEVAGACQRLRDGAQVEVDGDRGELRWEEEAW